jgi:hypothetical protein
VLDQVTHRLFGGVSAGGEFGHPFTVRSERAQYIPGLWAAFPDLCHAIDQQFVADDVVTTIATARGAHSGVLLGLPPTGNEVASLVISVDRVRDGQIVLHYGLPDWLAMLGAIGALPQPTLAVCAHAISGRPDLAPLAPSESVFVLRPARVVVVIACCHAPNHVQRVLDKLGARSRTKVAARAADLGLHEHPQTR